MKNLWTKAVTDNSVSKRELAHQKLAREAAAESIVLLQNDGTLPICAGKIALFGAGAAFTIKGGTGSGEVNERHAVTIWEGLKNAGFTITTEKWLNDYLVHLEEEKEAFYKQMVEMVKNAEGNLDDLSINLMANPFHYPAGRLITEAEIRESETDTAIYVISRQAGECSDRSLTKYEYTLEPNEIENIKKIAAGYAKTIVALNVGSSIDISPLEEIEGVNAVLYFCQQGMEGGSAFADVVTGKVSPSGCLTNTWAKKYDDLPFAREYSYLKGKIDKEYYKEGIYVGYRYFDSFQVAPRYEFGFGLSYTDFEVDCTDVQTNGSKVTATAKVTNVGTKFAGKKVVQLYVSCPNGILEREYQSLAAFGKSKELAPGESEELKLCFDLRELAGYDEETCTYLLDAGEYVLRLGASSRCTKTIAVLTLDEKAVTEQCKAVCPVPDGAIDALIELTSPEDLTACTDGLGEDIFRLAVKASDIPTVVHNYEEPDEKYSDKVNKWLQELSTEDQLKFVAGTGYGNMEEGFFVPGAAAFTCYDYLDKGICDVSLCDGPAGLRLHAVSMIKESGEIEGVGTAMEMEKYLHSDRLKEKENEQGTLVYQYTTAFPVGTALAQTWNTEMMEAFGQAVGAEMEEFGATFWLAPGMNIQRNPLCGRNYEYYSEDPLLTGKMAAAATRGVQSHEGCYVTIKHFAANNQEMDRNHSDSIIGERTLREIYLKGFKIAVQDSDPKSLMTSYNLLNGVYTPNSYDLCTNVLRYEWGFDGVVMSDWFSTAKGQAENGLAIKSGNDLIMPGGEEYLAALRSEFEKGILTKEDIRRSCARVLEAVANSKVQKEFEENDFLKGKTK